MFKKWWQSLTLKNPEDNSSNDKTAFGKIISQLTTRKPLQDIITQTNEGELTRLLGFFTLNTLGLGAIIGAGIFTTIGNAAANFAGPAEILSLLIGAVPAFLTALSYAEMASMIPASGSCYTYTYTVMGEYSAWLVGWDLCLQHMCAAAAVAVAWANYLESFIEFVSSTSIDHQLLSGPVNWNVTAQEFYVTESWMCLSAVLIILCLTAIIVYDVGASSLLNSIIVIAKILILITFICVCIKYIDPKNYHPILPKSEGGDTYGIKGMLHATTISFFAFIGFDSITTAAQEATKESAKLLPLSILTSLGIATILYLGIASVMFGVINYKNLKGTYPIGAVCQITGMKWLEILIYLAAIFGLTSVMLVNLYAQSRIFYSISKDGLLPPVFSKMNLLKRKSEVNNTASSSSPTTTATATIKIPYSAERTITLSAEIQEANKPAGSPVWASIITG
ncbi:unnamed protein product [Rotaria sp. Silwood1]|nr:unnamed protein product [Rotaria sp. Silwood1]CAF4816579.1 unnamed protein product [Rotaria sp. Silwood1]CAF4846444.1 unnamed protein product [Rotaria sp. Silwood1]